MKKLLFIITFLALVACVVYIALQKNGFNNNSILNLPKTIDLSVNCSEVHDLVVAAEVDVSVTNSSSRTHTDVTVNVTGYDKNGNITKVKTAIFDRTLGPNSSFSKPVTLPAKTKSCKCVIERSNPQ